MAKTTAKLLGLALVGASAYGAWTLGQGLLGDDEGTADTDHVVNQVWIERVPQDRRDMIGHLVMLETPEGRFGGAGRSSQWRHVVEIFQWGLRGNRLSVFFPQDRVKAQLTVRSWECEGEAPEPFELCLEIKNRRGQTATFYSREDWHIDPERAEASLAEIIADAPALSSVTVPVALDRDDDQAGDDDDRDDYADVDAFGGLLSQ